MSETLGMATRIAATDSSVLILGESGVGKELFAEYIHSHSVRRDGPLVRVNCAALPEHLLESELFGHVRGAYTDAIRDRRGRFELADGGTIFLDEVGELPLAVQAKMLRILQDQSFERLGASDSIRVNVRIIAATNSNLREAVESGRFRRDLYFRLNVLPLRVPALRERPDDVPMLARHFLQRHNQGRELDLEGFSDEAMERLLTYAWPGNVRELENVVERAVVVASGKYIQREDLMLAGDGSDEGDRYRGKSLKDATTMFKRTLIENSLVHHGWNQTATARTLGIQRTYLSRLIKELGIGR
jgi:Nif-specific regulatory protein